MQNITFQIKSSENQLNMIQKNMGAVQTEIMAAKSKFDLLKKQLQGAIKFFGSLTIEEIKSCDEKAESNQTPMDVQLKKLKELYDKYIIIEDAYIKKNEAYQKLNDDYSKEQETMAQLEEKAQQIQEQPKRILKGKSKKI